MSGRRSHNRFSLHLASPGSLQMFRDVVVQGRDGQDVVALSGEPAALGRGLSLELDGERRAVEVVESRPVSVDGRIRHRLRLRPVNVAAGGEVR